MRYSVNAVPGSDAAAILAALQQIGTNAVQPNPAILYFEVEGENLHQQIDAIEGVCGCCGADQIVHLQGSQAVDVNNWHLGAISGPPLSSYDWGIGEDGTGAVAYLVDGQVATTYFGSSVSVIHNPHTGPINSDHATNMAAFLIHPTHGVMRGGHIYSAQPFDGNGGSSVALINAALSAVLDHKNANHPGILAPVSNSYALYGTNVSNAFSAAFAALRGAGCIPVAAAGNGGINFDTSNVNYWPAEDPNCFAAGAHDINGVTAGFSNTGTAVKIRAPGVACQTIKRDGTTELVNGTSGACAVTAGAMARLISAGEADPEAKMLAMAQGGKLYLPMDIANWAPPPPPPPPTIPPADPAFRGACRKVGANSAYPIDWSQITDITSFFTSNLYDDGGWWNPAGYYEVIPGTARVQINLNLGGHDIRMAYLKQYNAQDQIRRDVVLGRDSSQAGATEAGHSGSVSLPVFEGDRFRVFLQADNTAQLYHHSYFSIERRG